MNRKFIFILWIIVAWVLPALIAGALGWKGVWGSGSAVADYLIPIPVAGGVLHVPSFVLVTLLLFTQPWDGPLAGHVRGILLAGALAGIVTLLDLDKLQLALSTDMLGGRFWQEQPLGLFILSDCVLAQLFVGLLGGRWPEDTREWAVSLVMALLIPAAYAMASLQADPRQQNPFVYVGARGTQNRGDEVAFYYSKLPPGSEAFRQAAAPLLERHDPRSNLNTEDIAIHFYDSLAAAQSQNPGAAKFTVCLYQDGTPTTWNPGSFDCFSQHESFTEHFMQASARQDPSLPQDVRSWLGRRDACAGRKPLTAPPGVHLDNQEVRACDPARAERRREELLKQFEGDESALAALK